MQNKKNDNLDKIFDGFVNLIFFYGRILSVALKSKLWQKSENYLLFLALFAFTSLLIYQDMHILIFQYFFTDFFNQEVERLSKILGLNAELAINFILNFSMFMFFLGIAPFKLKRKYQKAIDKLCLTNGLNEKPIVLNVENLNENRTKLLIKSCGFGKDRYETKFDDIRSSVGQKVESAKYFEKDNTCIELYLAKRPLEKIVNYSDVADKLTGPYSFIVGKSLKGLITQSIVDLPHLMIGGTTGGGKSVTFNNVLINLLESSENLELFLIDLKGGLEIKDYESLPNVELIKNVNDAKFILKLLHDEMNRRYVYLEKNNHKKLCPKRDKMNRIVVAIDECTDLLGKVDRGHPDYENIEQAKFYCDELARKARASGIHIILATQKIDKSSIPTRIQENMNGRIALRVKTLDNSVRLLGNGKASHLPSIPGRAIWSEKEDEEVQVPFMSNEEVKRRIKEIFSKYKKKEKTNFNSQINLQNAKKESTKKTDEFIDDDY